MQSSTRIPIAVEPSSFEDDFHVARLWHEGPNSYRLYRGTESYISGGMVKALHAMYLASQSDDLNQGWLTEKLDFLNASLEGDNLKRAITALKVAEECSSIEPVVYPAPAGGVVIDHRVDQKMISFIVEDDVGVLVSRSPSYSFHFEMQITNNNRFRKLMERYEFELKQI